MAELPQHCPVYPYLLPQPRAAPTSLLCGLLVSRPAGISKANEMEAGARPACGQQAGWGLKSKSPGSWHHPTALSGLAGLTGTAEQWGASGCLSCLSPPHPT